MKDRETDTNKKRRKDKDEKSAVKKVEGGKGRETHSIVEMKKKKRK